MAKSSSARLQLVLVSAFADHCFWLIHDDIMAIVVGPSVLDVPDHTIGHIAYFAGAAMAVSGRHVVRCQGWTSV